MAERIPARLTASEGRRFAFTVGGAFLFFAALMYWRAHPTRAMYVGGIGTLFLIAGLLVPTQLGPVERAWMGLAHQISRVTVPVFMAIVYFLVITPMGFVRRAFAGTPIRVKPGVSNWALHTPATPDPKSMERQF